MPDTFRSPRDPIVSPGGIEAHANDMTVTFAADIPLAVLQKKLAEADQWLPIDGEPSRPVGRLIETNSSGPLRLGYGAWRDLLLGVQFHNGAGELISAGGRTVKNVAGYDLSKFMAGQGGIFGKIITATTRTYRRPAGALLAMFAASDQQVGELFLTSLKPQWSVLTREKLLCGYLGDERTIEFIGRSFSAINPVSVQRRNLNDDIEHRAAVWAVSGESFRASVPPTRILEFGNRLGASEWVADAAFGIVIGPADASQRGVIIEAAKAVGGSVYFCDSNVMLDEMFVDPVQRRILQNLKAAFDPGRRLTDLPEDI